MWGSAIISKYKLKQYVISKGDSLSASVPTSELTFVREPSIGDASVKCNELGIKKSIMELIENAIILFKEGSHSS